MRLLCMQVPFGVMMDAQLGVPARFNLIHISHWICSGKNLVFVITPENKALISALLIDWFSLEKNYWNMALEPSIWPKESLPDGTEGRGCFPKAP